MVRKGVAWYRKEVGADLLGRAQSDAGTYWHFVERKKRRCSRCDHPELDHLGIREPGCTYLGTCSCPAFKR